MAVGTIELHPARITNIRTLFFANLTFGLCNGFYYVLLQPYIVEFASKYSRPEALLGLIMTAASIFQIIPMVLSPMLSDKIGRKRVYLAGVLLYVIAMIVYSFSYHIALIIIGVTLFNLGFGISEPSIQSLTAESSDDTKRASSFSLIGLAFYATGTVGPLVIMLVSDRIPLRYYFYGLTVGYGLLMIYQLFKLKESIVLDDFSPNLTKQFVQALQSILLSFKQMFTSLYYFLVFPYFIYEKRRNQKKTKLTENIDHRLKVYKDIFKSRKVKYSLLFFLWESFVFGLSISIFNGSVILVYNFTTDDVAIFSIVFNVASIAFFLPLTKYSDKLTKRELLVISELTGALFPVMNIIAYFTLPEYRIYPILISWACIGASVAFWIPSISSIVTNFDKSKRAEAYGTIIGLKNLGWFPTAFITGYIIEKVSILVPFIISAVLMPTVIFMALKFPKEIDIPHNSNTNNIDKTVIE